MRTRLPLISTWLNEADFENFYAASSGANADLLAKLHQFSQFLIKEPQLAIYGPKHAGKTHLLQAACVAALKNHKSCCYVPLRERASLTPRVLIGLEQVDLICLDDIDSLFEQGSTEAQWTENNYWYDVLLSLLSNFSGRLSRSKILWTASMPFAAFLGPARGRLLELGGDEYEHLYSMLVQVPQLPLAKWAEAELVAVFGLRTAASGVKLSDANIKLLAKFCGYNLEAMVDKFDQLYGKIFQHQEKRITLANFKLLLQENA